MAKVMPATSTRKTIAREIVERACAKLLAEREAALAIAAKDVSAAEFMEANKKAFDAACKAVPFMVQLEAMNAAALCPSCKSNDRAPGLRYCADCEGER